MCHFTIESEKIHPDGYVDVSFTFAFSEAKENKKTLHFTSIENYRYVITDEKTKYLSKALFNYVHHKRILSEVGGFYRTLNKLESLTKCIAMVDFIKDAKLPVICSQILLHKEDLRNILPSSLNPSYMGSLDNIISIIDFAKQNA
jgi:hypothetical protein